MNDNRDDSPIHRLTHEPETDPIPAAESGATQDLPVGATAPDDARSAGETSDAKVSGAEVSGAEGSGAEGSPVESPARRPSQVKNLAIAGAVGIAIVFAGAGFGAGYWAGDSGSGDPVPAVNQMGDPQSNGQVGESPLGGGDLGGGRPGEGQFDGPMGVPPGGQLPDGRQLPGQGSDGTDSPGQGDSSEQTSESGGTQTT
jgi:hypothetical protein